MNQVISASRRTDLPRVFPGVLASWLTRGWVKVKNPFNQKERTVNINPEAVHTLVLWSKDYEPLIKNQHGLRSILENYAQLFFHFTVTGMGGTRLEPGIISYKHALFQFEQLVKIAGDARRVNWRFDPIVFWKDKSRVNSNLVFFHEIAAVAANAGIKTATFSLCQWYQKSKKRAKEYGLNWIEPRKTRYEALSRLIKELATKYNIEIRSCCTPAVTLFGILPAKCINGKLLSELHPQKLTAPLGKDPGQRKACGCSPSVDIGSYDLTCPKGCVYCYANPKSNINDNDIM